MVFIKDHGFVDSPSSPRQFKIIDGVTTAIKIAKKLGYKVIIVSNQPGVAKGYYDEKTFDAIRKKMHKEFLRSHVSLDDEFYCLHHPNAKLSKYRKKCSCRKPGIALIEKATRVYNIDLKKSYFIGDGIVDIEAAKKAGCKSIFVGNVSSTITRLFERKDIWPDHVAHNLLDAVNFVATS